MASQKLFKVHFTSGMPPMIASGTSRSRVAKAVKKQYGARAIGTIENVSRDGAIGFGFLPMQWKEEKEEDSKNTLKLQIAKGDDEEEGEDEQEIPGGEDGEGEDGVDIGPDSPDANGDGKVDADDDLNGDGVVDAKDLKIAELEKDIRIKELEGRLDDMDDGIPTVEDPKVPERPRIKDTGESFEILDHKGDVIHSVPYERDDAKSKREEARRWISRWYDEQINGKSGAAEAESDEESDKEDKSDKKDAEEQKESYIPFPAEYVSINEAVNLDARTKTFKETLKRLQYAKSKSEEGDVSKDDEEKFQSDDEKQQVKENAFIYAAAKAKAAGKKSFEFNGKTYKVTLKNHSISEAGYNDVPKTKADMDKKNPDLETDVKNKDSKELQSLVVKEATEDEHIRMMIESINVQSFILLAKAGLVSKENLADMKVALKAMDDGKELKPKQRGLVVDVFQKLADFITNDRNTLQKAKKSFREDLEVSSVYSEYISKNFRK